jgi:hypothetical protein
MASLVRSVLDYRMTVAEWIGTAVLVNAPYLAIGVVWSLTHTGHLARLDGPAKAVSLLAAVATWPVLLFSEVCTP